MSVHVYWQDDEHTILVYRVASPWNLGDLYNALAQAGELSSEQSPEYIIFDVSRSDTMPRGFFSSIRHMQRAYSNTVKLRVLVGADGTTRSIFSIIKRVAPNLTRTVYLTPQLNDALTLIEQHQDD